MIEISHTVSIPDNEYWFEYSHSRGPGGQNVNKTSSRVTLCFPVGASENLSEYQKHRIATVLDTRISNRGVLRISADNHRTRKANQAAACERLQQLLKQALKPSKTRRPVRPSRSSKERRLDHKRQRAQVKKNRSRVREAD